MATKIGLNDVRLEGNRVVFHGRGGNALANSLVQKNTSTIGELADKFGFIDPSEISIGNDGTVTINNASLAAKVKEMSQAKGAAPPPFFDTNCSCK